MAFSKYIGFFVLFTVLFVIVLVTTFSFMRQELDRKYVIPLPHCLTGEQPADIVEAKEERRLRNIQSSEFLGTGYYASCLNSLSLTDAQKLFHGNFKSTTYKCQNIKRFGNVADGGYDLCMDDALAPKKNNCLVYSFGIRNEWSFDEAINSYLGCDVYSFDPSIRLPNHTHREPNMYFYNFGIWGSNWKNKNNWELRDLTTIVKSLQHENLFGWIDFPETGHCMVTTRQSRVIDYLKADVEGSEWPLITHIIKSDVHKQIKQIGFELHTPRYNIDNQSMTAIDYAEIYYGLREMERLGFRRFLHYHNNNCCGRFAQLMPESIAGRKLCCYETFYVNGRFLRNEQNMTMTYVLAAIIIAMCLYVILLLCSRAYGRARYSNPKFISKVYT